MQLLTLRNLDEIKNDYPRLRGDLQQFVNFVNTFVQKVGGYTQLVAAGGISISGSSGVIDVKISDNSPRAGEEYFLDRATSSAFAGTQTIPLGPSRNWRDTTVPGITTFWRWYKSTKLGGVSNYVVFGGNSPIGVNPGGTAGPAPSGGSSGSSAGGGYGGRDSCVIRGTKIKPLCGGARITELPNSRWIVLRLANGFWLIATPDHPVMTEHGKMALEGLSIGENVITTKGLSAVSSLRSLHRKGVKLRVTMPKGHLFWANGILSHNLKP